MSVLAYGLSNISTCTTFLIVVVTVYAVKLTSNLGNSIISVILTVKYVTNDNNMVIFVISSSKLIQIYVLFFDILIFCFYSSSGVDVVFFFAVILDRIY